jgi:probable phosphoglycerate mutase
MTTFYLIRHASNDFFQHTLVGRNPGVHLNEIGRRETERLAERLAGEGIQKFFSSPMERCCETAEPLAGKCNLNVEISAALNEVDFGDWAGRTFVELDQLERWKQWNTFRSAARTPNGETMFEVQNRVVGFVEKLSRECAGQRIALVSHGDPIRAVILYFLGTPLEFIRRIEISPASVSILAISDWEAQIRCLNARNVQT